jgi:uncharacterized protein (DUF433 family)
MTENDIHLYIDMHPSHAVHPIFKGTEIKISHIVDDFANGMKEADILQKHPEPTEKHIQACRTALKEGNYARYGVLSYFIK